MQRRVLTTDGIGDGVAEAVDAFPFARWPHGAIAADLIDAPIDLQPMPIGIAELDGDLAAGPAPPLEVDRHAMSAQMIARAQNLVERRNFECQMIEFKSL